MSIFSTSTARSTATPCHFTGRTILRTILHDTEYGTGTAGRGDQVRYGVRTATSCQFLIFGRDGRVPSETSLLFQLDFAMSAGTSTRAQTGLALKDASVKDQVKNVVDALNKSSASVKTLYVDVEQPYSKRYPWPKNVQQNQNFIQDMVNNITAHGIRAGIYTSASGWYPVVGYHWTNVSCLPLFWTTGRKKVQKGMSGNRQPRAAAGVKCAHLAASR